ncbi:MAG: two-component sensor histidine kinase [Bacteroidetes bacterium]|nr:two-component sensor histidine kinase [Bacteroidota bacterium]
MKKLNQVKIVVFVYWFLLVYIIAALVWWFIALQQQNIQMMEYKLEELKHDDIHFIRKTEEIHLEAKRKTAQYIGEGSTFLLLIIVGAVFVYRAVRRQFKLQQQQQNFMMAVTHELKTPIAVAKLNLETLQRYKLDEDKRQKMLQSALSETNRLNTLASNILVSSQLEGGNYYLSKENLDLSALVIASAKDYQQRFPEKKWQVNVHPDISVKGDTLLLQMLVNNLIENAIKYSPKQSQITIKLKKENNSNSVLYVKDEGPGIPADEKKKIFEKFYRVGNESTRSAQGTGLGLYLCKKIAKDHNASIGVTDNSPSGSIFTVTF